MADHLDTTKLKMPTDVPILDIHEVLEDPELEEAFFQNCRAQFSEESMEFLRATNGPYTHRLNWIIETFIRDTGGFGGKMINISSDARNAIMTEAGRLSQAGLGGGVNYRKIRSAIDRARTEVRKMLNADPLHNFHKSEEYRGIMKQRTKKPRRPYVPRFFSVFR